MTLLTNKVLNETILSNKKTLKQALDEINKQIELSEEQEGSHEFLKKIFGEVWVKKSPLENDIYSFLLKNQISLSEWENLSEYDKAMFFVTSWLNSQVELVERYYSQINQEIRKHLNEN